MSDIDPVIKLNLAGEEFEATPDNAHLYKFLGELACYSHVFLVTGYDDDADSYKGSYIFQNSAVFGQLALIMMNNGFPLHLNLREVPDCDVSAFNRMIDQQVADIDDFPDEWLDNK